MALLSGSRDDLERRTVPAPPGPWGRTVRPTLNLEIENRTFRKISSKSWSIISYMHRPPGRRERRDAARLGGTRAFGARKASFSVGKERVPRRERTRSEAGRNAFRVGKGRLPSREGRLPSREGRVPRREGRVPSREGTRSESGTTHSESGTTRSESGRTRSESGTTHSESGTTHSESRTTQSIGA